MNAPVAIGPAETTWGMDRLRMLGGKVAVDQVQGSGDAVTMDWSRDYARSEWPWEDKAQSREIDAEARER